MESNIKAEDDILIAARDNNFLAVKQILNIPTIQISWHCLRMAAESTTSKEIKSYIIESYIISYNLFRMINGSHCGPSWSI